MMLNGAAKDESKIKIKEGTFYYVNPIQALSLQD